LSSCGRAWRVGILRDGGSWPKSAATVLTIFIARVKKGRVHPAASESSAAPRQTDALQAGAYLNLTRPKPFVAMLRVTALVALWHALTFVTPYHLAELYLYRISGPFDNLAIFSPYLVSFGLIMFSVGNDGTNTFTGRCVPCDGYWPFGVLSTN